MLHTDDHFALRGGDLDLWMATCANADETQRFHVYMKAARIGRVDVLASLAPTIETTRLHNHALCAAIIYEQFECADWIEHNTNVDMFLVEHIFNYAFHFDFSATGEPMPVVANNQPFFQRWIDYQHMEQCRIQKETIEGELELNTNNRVRKI